MTMIVTVQLLLDVSDDDEAADAVNEILREQQRDFVATSCLIDYAFGTLNNVGRTVPVNVDNYQEGDFLAYCDASL